VGLGWRVEAFQQWFRKPAKRPSKTLILNANDKEGPKTPPTRSQDKVMGNTHKCKHAKRNIWRYEIAPAPFLGGGGGKNFKQSPPKISRLGTILTTQGATGSRHWNPNNEATIRLKRFSCFFYLRQQARWSSRSPDYNMRRTFENRPNPIALNSTYY